MATVVSRILSADQEAEVQRQAAKMAAVRECEHLIECAKLSVTGITVSCGGLCRRPSVATSGKLLCRFKDGARSSATYDVETSTFSFTLSKT